MSVLALAIGAFVVDKAFLGHTEPSYAAAETGTPAAAAGNVKAIAKAQESLAHRLERHRTDAMTPAGRAFIAPAGFFPEAEKAATAGETQAVQASVVQIEWPRLGAVVTGASPGAILNGRLVRLGETIGGVVLVSVSERSVIVRHGEHESVLTLDEAVR